MKKKTFRTAGTVILLGLLCILPAADSGAGIAAPGFHYRTLSRKYKRKITGISFHKNPYISYRDLRYIKVKYINFKGETKTGELIVNKRIAKKTANIFYELYKIRYPIQRIRLIDEYNGDDESSMSHNNSSAFNYRKIAGTETLSKHAYGLAIDINPRINPYIVGNRVSPENAKIYRNRNRKTNKGKYRRYMIHKNDKIVKIFERHGFSWGGDWTSRKDYQHFEYKR